MSADTRQEAWLILGASSALARAFAHRAARGGASLVLLAGRDAEDLGRTATDLAIRHGVEAEPIKFDARDPGSHSGFARDCEARCGGRMLNLLLAFGIMPDQAETDRDPGSAGAMVETNFTGAASVLAAFAPVLTAQRGGAVVALGSVAGDRGRPRNHLYGATKAALHTYLQGYAAKLSRAGVRVVCIKAGVFDTAMTWPLAKLPFMASPDAFAEAAWRLAHHGPTTAYVPRVWWPVMTAIRLLPTRIFNRLDI